MGHGMGVGRRRGESPQVGLQTPARLLAAGGWRLAAGGWRLATAGDQGIRESAGIPLLAAGDRGFLKPSRPSPVARRLSPVAK